METKPPLPPFNAQTAAQKVRMAEDAWNTRDPDKVVLVYTEDTRWRNRAEFPVGREQVHQFLQRKWAKDEVQLTARYDYATLDNVVNSTDMVKGAGLWRHDLPHKLFSILNFQAHLHLQYVWPVLQQWQFCRRQVHRPIWDCFLNAVKVYAVSSLSLHLFRSPDPVFPALPVHLNSWRTYLAN